MICCKWGTCKASLQYVCAYDQASPKSYCKSFHSHYIYKLILCLFSWSLHCKHIFVHIHSLGVLRSLVVVVVLRQIIYSWVCWSSSYCRLAFYLYDQNCIPLILRPFCLIFYSDELEQDQKIHMNKIVCRDYFMVKGEHSDCSVFPWFCCNTHSFRLLKYLMISY